MFPMNQANMIKDLMHPSAYPETPKKITLAQTHISSVFIGDEFVYKIKKPLLRKENIIVTQRLNSIIGFPRVYTLVFILLLLMVQITL